MTDEAEPLATSADKLREDLRHEYYAIVEIVAGFDQGAITVKGWSVTLSLAGLRLGFQQKHFALFGLAALTALAFWGIDLLLKQHRISYYSRMRDIEVAAYELNRVALPELGQVSAPRIDTYWPYRGSPGRDWRTDRPERRTPDNLHRLIAVKPFRMPQVFLPHAVAVALGLLLFIGAVGNLPGLDHLEP